MMLLKVMLILLPSMPRPLVSPSFRPRQIVDRLRKLADVDVCIARHHRERLPAAEPLQRQQVAVLGVMPRRPSVTTTVRREILDT